MKVGRNCFGELAEAILEVGAIQAVKYYSPKLRVKATRRIFGGKIRKNEGDIEILFSIGSLNYAEWKFAKKAKEAGEPFPIKKLQLKWLKKAGGRG
jgi:hypothetical protein